MIILVGFSEITDSLIGAKFELPSGSLQRQVFLTASQVADGYLQVGQRLVQA